MQNGATGAVARTVQEGGAPVSSRTILIALIVGTFVWAVWASAGDGFTRELQTVRKSCEAQVPLGANVIDDDRTSLLIGMSFIGPNSSYRVSTDLEKAATIDAARCLLLELEAPEDLVARVLDTKATRPMAVAEWSQYRVVWAVQPNGLGQQLEVAIGRRGATPGTIDYIYP